MPIVTTSCSDFKAKTRKAAVESMHAQEIAEADLERMKEVLDEYETQFMPKLPVRPRFLCFGFKSDGMASLQADMQSNGQVQFSEADTALEGAINTYETQ